MNQRMRLSPIRLAFIGAAIIFLLILVIPRGASGEEVDISVLMELAQDGQLQRIEVVGDELNATAFDGETFRSRKESGVSILELLEQRGVSTGADGLQVEIKEVGGSFFGVILQFLPLILFGALIIYMLRRSQGGIGQAMSLGRSKAREVAYDKPGATFDDVAGADEAKLELAEVVEFLRNPSKFTRLGAKIPKGLLLVGAPGTGKTLLSRAVAGEAGVPFFSTSGSDFVEMFVGVGASRVRDLFSRAKLNAPALVFIDEIDAVGRHRGAGIGGGNDEREQTLNQILVEMDGFDERTNVIVIAATNRPDILDPALIRPGRFDRRVVLDLPDVRGRQAILAVHLKDKPVTQGLDLETIARQTPGFTGADLANLANEAAILAAREGGQEICLPHFEEAIERVIAGPARKSRRVSQRERKIVAYHEAGHALVASQLPDADPVHKVSIVVRGTIGGHTRLLPDEDRGLWSKGQFEATLAVMMGGQAAEEIVFGDVTTGASNDLQNASRMARKMVTEYGMSEDVGPQTFETGQDLVFLGKELTQAHSYSDAMAERIDNGVGELLGRARETAVGAIKVNRDKLVLLAEKLLADETVQGQDLLDLLGDPAENEPIAA